MRLILVLFICFNLTQSAYSQHTPGKKDYYVLIDDSSFTPTTPDKGAWIKGYYEKDSLQKIEIWFGYNFGDLRREFYYWKGQLIMVTETQRLYSTNPEARINIDSVKPNYNARYTFLNGKLKDVNQKGTYSFQDTPADKATMEATFLNLSAQYIKTLDEKRAVKKNRIKQKKKK